MMKRSALPFVLVALVMLVTGAYYLVVSSTPALAYNANITYTTISDLNRGYFYHAGLTRDTAAGGDGDGEVRLLTIGISAATWRSDGNVTNLPALQGHTAVQKNGYIYVAGGDNGTGNVSSVYYTTINTTTHNVANWTATTSLPAPRFAHAMAAANSYVYVLGGRTADGVVDTVFYSKINSNGSLGAWTTAAAHLPVAVMNTAATVVSDTIYVIGGLGIAGSQNTVWYARPDPNTGAISSWNTTTAALPKSVQQHTAASSGGYIYIIGGIANDLTFSPDVYYGVPGSNGNVTSWITTSPLPNNMVYASGAAYAGQLYAAGGAFNSGSTLTKTIESDLMNPDGSLLSNAWTNSDVLSVARQRTAAVLSDDGWLYVIEGNNGIGASNPLHSIDYGPTAGAGATRYARDGSYTSNVIDLTTANATVNTLTWWETVGAGDSISLTYRYGNTPDLSAAAWRAWSPGAQGTNVSNALTVNQKARYFQFQVRFGTTIDNLTPVLNKVRIDYTMPDPPDLVPTGFLAPVDSRINVTRTVTVTVTNQGIGPAPAMPIRPLQDGARPTRLAPTAQGPLADYSFFWVDVYIDRGGPPLAVTDGGDCWNSVQPAATPLPPGGSVLVPIQCFFKTADPHTYYVQVDTCDNFFACGNFGYIFESNETNNILGPIRNGVPYYGPPRFTLPLIRR